MQDDLFDDGPVAGNLRIIEAVATSVSRGSYHDVFDGLSGHLRIITYSAGLRFIRTLLGRFDTIDIIIGSEKTLHKDIVAAHGIALMGQKAVEAGYQIRDAGDLAAAISKTYAKDDEFIRALTAGKVRFFVHKGSLSHDKLFLISPARGERATMCFRGSVNSTTQAFTSNEESLVIFRDALAISAAEQDWTRSHENSASLPTQYFSKAHDDDKGAQVAAFNVLFPESSFVPIPVREASATEIPEITVNVFGMPELPPDIRPVVRQMGSGKQKRLVMDTTPIKKPINTLPAVLSGDLTITGISARVSDNGRSFVLNQHVVSRAGLVRVSEDDARAHFSSLYSFMDNYRKNPGGDDASLKAIWCLAVWFFSTPFLSSTRIAALAEDLDPTRYPNHALVTGAAGIGKSSIGDVLATAVYGHAVHWGREGQKGMPPVKMAQEWRQGLGCYPLIIDDLRATQLGSETQFIRVVKDDNAELAPTYSSSNADADNIRDDVRRRSLVVPLRFGPRSRSRVTPEDDAVINRARRTGGVPFRHWHALHGAEVAGEIESMSVHRMSDLFGVISRTLRHEFLRLVPQSADSAWLSRVDQNDFYRVAHAQTFAELKRLVESPANLDRLFFRQAEGMKVLDVSFTEEHQQKDYAYLKKNLPGDVKMSDKSSMITINLSILAREHGWHVSEDKARMGFGKRVIRMEPLALRAG